MTEADNNNDNDNKVRSGKDSVFTSYKPREYWLERGKGYKEKFHYDKSKKLQEQVLVNYLKNLSFSSVLELGCGFGRITKLLIDNFEISKYHAVDISPHQIENAKDYLKETLDKNPPDEMKFLVSEIQTLAADRKYDLVIACEVLLHVLPSEIESVINKVVGLSQKHIVNIDWYQQDQPKKIAPHNFIHQYEQIYKKIANIGQVQRIPIVKKGGLLSVNNLDTKQSIFHAQLIDV